jgi:hypothetical protein
MSTRAKKPPQAAVEPEERPDWWDFDTDGELVVGTFVKAGKGGTRMGGMSPFVVLDLGDEIVKTVWLHHKTLREQFRREVAERGPIKEGERISIKRLGERESSENEGFTYTNYRTEFLDRSYSQEEIFGVEKPAESDSDESKSVADPADGDIPFEPTG